MAFLPKIVSGVELGMKAQKGYAVAMCLHFVSEVLDVKIHSSIKEMVLGMVLQEPRRRRC